MTNVLESLVDAASLSAQWMTEPRKLRRRITGRLSYDEWKHLTAGTLRIKAVNSLRRGHWIESRRRGNIVVFALRSDVIVKLIQQKIRLCSRIHPSGTYTLVAFDFPEAAAEARKCFRRFLSSAGFDFKQLSVWISIKDVVVELKQLAGLLGIQKWVEVYRCTES